jgi:hypothetical protein
MAKPNPSSHDTYRVTLLCRCPLGGDKDLVHHLHKSLSGTDFNVTDIRSGRLRRRHLSREDYIKLGGIERRGVLAPQWDHVSRNWRIDDANAGNIDDMIGPFAQ